MVKTCALKNSVGECLTGEVCANMKCNGDKIFTKAYQGAPKPVEVIRFGTKYNGRAWTSVPVDFLYFVVSEKCKTSKYNKDAARRELKRRGR